MRPRTQAYSEQKVATEESLADVVWVPGLVRVVEKSRPLPSCCRYFTVFDLLDRSVRVLSEVDNISKT